MKTNHKTNKKIESKTHFPSPKRLEHDKIIKQKKMVESIEYIKELLESVSNISIIINENRQIIYSNNLLQKTLGTDLNYVLGMRLGEAIGCMHSHETTEGCGTSEACKYCGALRTILACQNKNEKISSESRITIVEGDKSTSLDLGITASPIVVEGERYIVLQLVDISHIKRLKYLENLFFHDIINKASAFSGLVDSLNEKHLQEELVKKYFPILDKSAKELLDEIISHKNLILAENNDLKLEYTDISITNLINQVATLYKHHDVAKGKNIVIDPDLEEFCIFSDVIILKRILGNLVKNALEASAEGQSIFISSQKINDTVKFFVKNQTVIPRNVELQIFQRSFSTKGSGRGLGTYSVKLLTERYLKGSTGFETSAENGTTFFFTIPIHPAAK